MKNIRNTKLFNDLKENPELKTLFKNTILKDFRIPPILGGLKKIEIKPRGIYFYCKGIGNLCFNFVIRPEIGR